MQGMPPGGQVLSEAASELGITLQELISALGRPPNLEKASEILGISIEELRKFIPVPPTR